MHINQGSPQGHGLVMRIERTLSHRQYGMRCFLDIQRSFDNVSVDSIKVALLSRCVNSTVARWIVAML